MKFDFPNTPIESATPGELKEPFRLNNIRAFNELGTLPGTRLITKYPGIYGILTKRKSSLFNPFFVDNNWQKISPDSIKEICSDLRATSIPFMFEVSDTAPNAVHEMIKSQQPKQISYSTQVVFDAHNYEIQKLKHLEIEIVRNQTTLNDWTKIFASVFQGYGALGDAFLEWANLYNPGLDKPFILLVGYLQGEPVTVGSCVVSNGVVNIYNIATLDMHQKKGFGFECVNELLRICKSNGYRYFGGNGSEAGMNLYRKGKIEEIGKITRYLWG